MDRAWGAHFALANRVGPVIDAHTIIDALDGIELDGARADAALLALVASQDVEPGDDEDTWRIAQRVAPDLVMSAAELDGDRARPITGSTSANTSPASL